jgi:hypothetical protein
MNAPRTARNPRVPTIPAIVAALLLALPSPAPAAGSLVISGETVWRGRVEVTDDVLISETGRLVIEPGTEVVVTPSEGSRTDPHFYATDTEIMVRGALSAAGTDAAPIVFRRGEGDPGTVWGGIFVEGAKASGALSKVRIEGAHAGVTAVEATVSLRDSTVTACGYGVVVDAASKVDLAGTRITGNQIGLVSPGKAGPFGAAVSGNADRDLIGPAPAAPAADRQTWHRLDYRHFPGEGSTDYLGEHGIAADITWSGRVTIRGQVTIQPGATLTILPGTQVLFRKLDTNGDGLGESVLHVLGTLRVLGEPDNWVLFSSAEESPRAGDWDKVSLVASDSPDNVVRWARFSYGYQAFHDHFSSVALTGVIFDQNYRGVQFQEAPSVTIDGAWFHQNRSAMRFRDSTVSLSSILVEGNVTGINYLRCTTKLSDAVITGTFMDPLLGRESVTTLSRVLVLGNREGPRFKGDGSKVGLSECAVAGNLEDGLSLSGTEGTITASLLEGNGLDGLSITGGQVKVSGSSLAFNGRWAIDNNGDGTIDARDNWWGTNDPPAIDGIIWDKRDEPGVGKVLHLPTRVGPPGLLAAGVPRSTFPGGEVTVLGDVDWPAGSACDIPAGTTVTLSGLPPMSPLDRWRDHPHFRGSELIVEGSPLLARGTKEKPIAFRGPELPEGERQGAINGVAIPALEVDWCSFTSLATGLHLSGTTGRVAHTRFEGNDVGLRFNTSPLTVDSCLFRANRFGLRFHLGEPDVRASRFERNATAVFVSDEAGKHRFSGNAFASSRDYDVSLGEGVETDVTFTGNWWENNRELPSPTKLYDRADSPHLGRVLFDPVLGDPPPNPTTP